MKQSEFAYCRSWCTNPLRKHSYTTTLQWAWLCLSAASSYPAYFFSLSFSFRTSCWIKLPIRGL